MSFLKKLGQIVVKGLEIVTGFAPVVQSLMPNSTTAIQTVSQDLAQIASIITQMEAVGAALGLAGPDKLRGASPLIAQVILSSSMLANHQVADGALFTQGCTKIGDGMADCLNSLKENVQTVDKAA